MYFFKCSIPSRIKKSANRLISRCLLAYIIYVIHCPGAGACKERGYIFPGQVKILAKRVRYSLSQAAAACILVDQCELPQICLRRNFAGGFTGEITKDLSG